jgi:hypothetical protein
MATEAPERIKAAEDAGPPPADMRPTPAMWAATYVPFGLGLVAALMYAEASQDLRLFRTLYTIRLAAVVSIVALVLFPSRHRSAWRFNVWRLAWTFGFLAYLIHFLYSWFGVFGGQVATADQYPKSYGFPEGSHPTTWDLVLQHQGTFVLCSNLVVTGLWALDVLLVWTAERARGFFGGVVGFIHLLAWLHVLASFGVATLVFGKNPVSKGLGYALAGVVGLSLLLWLIGLFRSRRATSAA